MALTAKKVYAILKRQISDMEAKLNSPVRYRGTVATADLLPLNPDIGDMYNIESKSIYGEAGMNVAWNGVVWDTMGAPIDMSLYLTKEEAEAVIQRLVTEYFEKNPVKPGATTEQAQQIEQNKTDIASLKTETSSLKEDLSTKITKFYASSQGETHLADSDNGKIMDMMLYGKSEQKQYSGKNLLNATLQTTTWNGVTCTNNNDGTITLNGTATADCAFIVIGRDNLKNAFGTNEELRLTGAPKGASKTGYYLQIWKNEPEVMYYDTGGGVTAKKPNANCNVAIMIVKGTVCNNLLFKPMLTTDLTATYDDFEPYTGGIPSPNPDYPQEIKSVVNPTVKVCGKNLFDKNNCYDNKWIKDLQGNLGIINGFFTTNHIFVKKGATVAIRKTNTARRGYFNISKTKFTYTESTNTTFTAIEDCWLMVSCNKAITPIEDFQIELGSTPTAYEPYHEQTVTLPYTLNAIPVNSGGNVTIDGQQYIADYVDVEREKLVKMVDSSKLDNTQSIVNKIEWLLAEPQEIDLTTEEITAFKALATYYPTTNISVNSEQLDGYTVFNYPISMENGWNYVKQQIGDTRDYIYDMDARTQDTDLQAAEAYVNSEYAVALTELEV